MKKLILVLLISAFPFTFTQSAFAHAEIAKTSPTKNAILAQPPKSVWIEFGESLLTLDAKVVNTLTVTNSTMTLVVHSQSIWIHKSLSAGNPVVRFFVTHDKGLNTKENEKNSRRAKGVSRVDQFNLKFKFKFEQFKQVH